MEHKSRRGFTVLALIGVWDSDTGPFPLPVEVQLVRLALHSRSHWSHRISLPGRTETAPKQKHTQNLNMITKIHKRNKRNYKKNSPLIRRWRK
ncbi:hypothetical protein DRN82_00850 [Thermococci archaeon]|nr:MAG: hypothetical protein DRN82_00850 [Thermococci archaeon]